MSPIVISSSAPIFNLNNQLAPSFGPDKTNPITSFFNNFISSDSFNSKQCKEGHYYEACLESCESNYHVDHDFEAYVFCKAACSLLVGKLLQCL